MAEMQMPTIIETGKDRDNGWGGNAWGAGAGAFIGSMFGNGGFGGWGNARGAGQIGADVAIQNGIQNLGNQVQQGNLMNLQGQNQLQQGVSGAAADVTNGIYQNALSNLQGQNGIQMQIANSGAAITNGQSQQTIANLQGQNAQNVNMLQGFAGVGQQLCCLGGKLSQEIDQTGDQINASIQNGTVQGMRNTQQISDRLCQTNQNILNQGYENRLLGQNLASQLQGQHADLKAEIIKQGCQDREVMREIANQAVRDKLAEANAKIANLETRQALTDSNQSQTLYMMNRMEQLFQQYQNVPAAAGA